LGFEERQHHVGADVFFSYRRQAGIPVGGRVPIY